MWSTIKNNFLLASVTSIFSIIISAILSYIISINILKKQLKTEFWKSKFKNIELLLDMSLASLDKHEPIFMVHRQYGWKDAFSFRTKIETLAIRDNELKKLLLDYCGLIDNYNNEYFNLTLSDPYEKNRDPKVESGLVDKYKKDFVNLHLKIKERIEKIST